MQFAHDHPDRLYSVTTVGSPVKLGPPGPPRPNDPLARGDVEAWARSNMGNRLGSDASPEFIEYWSKFMGSARVASVRGVLHMTVDLTPVLSEIKTPTLMITTSKSKLVPLATMKEWIAAFPHGELHVIDSDSYHVAATRPEECAQVALDFFRKVERQGQANKS